MSNHRCICMWRGTEQCPVHPDVKPVFRSMFPTSTPGETVPYFEGDIGLLDAEWNRAQRENEAARQARRDVTSSCPDCRFNDPCPAHAGGSC